ncbi:hypothetical protein BDF20DRAFT_974130 [Mycotypha africana]|uniref:uncharacterized protein n=1 Tax=Mycotypha africana TaxID=64632 RepID=UPI002301C7EE|nr:uncharacterized protein BDF20DRAFT_974130 [Mycotypha africana]KAI8979253.1 hypothetical protein BDF20DRAFT_974130 [Mycotypha africana]
MADTVKFHSENEPALQVNESPNEETERKQENMQEIKNIQQKNQTTSEEQKEKQEEHKNPGNTLDASGNVHTQSETELKQEQQQKNKETGNAILPEQADHQHVWSNNPDEPYAKQWAPTMNEPPQGMNDARQNSLDMAAPRRRSSQSSLLDRTMTDLKTIFDTSDQSSITSKKSRLHHSTPLEPVQPEDLVWNLQIKALKYIIVASVVCYLVGRWKYGIIFGFLLICFCAWAYWNLGRTSSEGLQWQLEKQEGLKTLYTSEGESVEWLNYMVEKIWRSVDPEIFADVEDILEDTLQSVAPKIIQAVKVSDFDLGVQAPRVQMIRVFPPLPGQPEESIFGEAAFSFHAHPVASLVTNRGPKSTPPGLAIRFQTALKAPIDIKAELTALSGKIRFKILTAPGIPFISKVTIAFTSVPKIETGVMPLSKHLNIMNLPTIKTLVNEGIKLGFADLVDPKSMTVDVRALMGAFNQDTNAIGVVKVEVRGATRDASLNLQDMEDSYASLSLSTQPKKSSSSTRILTNDKDPRWDENLYVLVYKDDVVTDTKVDVKVWDADKVKFDDLWGSVSVSVKDIVQGKLDKLGNVESYCQEERTIYDGWVPIDGKNEEESKVKLNMKMSFHPKYPTAGMEIFSGDMISKKEKPEAVRKQEEKEMDALLNQPLDPLHTNGILSVTIHQAVDLEIGDPEVLPTTEEFKHPYSPNSVVSPYACFYINDKKVYQTRTKLRNPSPHWNAITENFVRDINNTSIRISVKNSVELERDPVLGTKCFSLKDLFQDQGDKFKEVQKWIPLSNGIGFGKVLLSIKYKPVKMTLPRELQGCDVGTLVVERLSLSNLKDPFTQDDINSTKATLALNVDPAIIKRLKSKNIGQRPPIDETEVDPDIVEKSGPYGWYGQHLYFPLMMRYRTALYVQLSQGTVSTNKATGRCWLKHTVDNEWQDITIGLHDHISLSSKLSNRNEDAWSEEGRYGQVTLRIKIIPGFSAVHTHLRSYRKDMVGADPFYGETLKVKAQKWIKEQNEKKEKTGNEEEDDIENDYDLQTAVQEEKNKTHSNSNNGFDGRRRRSSSISSEYGEDDDTDDSDADLPVDIDETEMHADIIDQKKKSKISKHRVVRKVAWGLDKVKHKVDVLREGFNSESRAERSVAKEI